jgi:hypothetical protein
MNSSGERASIECNAAQDAFRYSVETGDPINYQPVIEALSRKNQIDAHGFAPAEAWMTETLTHRYPVALERIVRGHTQVTLNPASILISLKNDHVHAGWLIKKGSEFVKFGGTHGALDDLNSNGMLLSNFTPTEDTSANRVAAQFDDFPGLRDFRATGNGAEWVSTKKQALTRIARVPFDRDYRTLPGDEVFLRIWTPGFTHLPTGTPVDVTVRKARQFLSAHMRRGDPMPVDPSEEHLTLTQPVSFPHPCAYERVYARPAGLILEPQTEYRISGRIRDGKKTTRIFEFLFRTDARGQPVAY